MKTLLMLSSLGLMAAAKDAPDAGGAPPAEKPKDSKKVKVKVLSGAVGEEGLTYLKGETFDTTPDRAAALGDSVEVVK